MAGRIALLHARNRQRRGLGMLQITSREPKPALAAFGQIQAWLREREVLSCRALPPDVWTC